VKDVPRRHQFERPSSGWFGDDEELSMCTTVRYMLMGRNLAGWWHATHDGSFLAHFWQYRKWKHGVATCVRSAEWHITHGGSSAFW
jgi:hypothetical protein